VSKGRPKYPESADTDAPKAELTQEISELLDQVLVQEASNEVWSRFEQALSQFDEPSLEVFEAYLDGATLEQLSKENNLSQKEIENWINSLKRKLVQGLKQGTSVRQ